MTPLVFTGTIKVFDKGLSLNFGGPERMPKRMNRLSFGSNDGLSASGPVVRLNKA
jgi:hypothetical protein